MTFGIFLRTAAAGSAPDVIIADLGYRVTTGETFRPISSASDTHPNATAGNFTATQIKDSLDLYNAIKNEAVEWSTDGISPLPPDKYEPDILILHQLISGNHIDLSENGRLTVRRVTAFSEIEAPSAGELVFKDGYHYGFDGNDWHSLVAQPSVKLDHPPPDVTSLWIESGLLKYYDNTREKWLSSESLTICCGRNGLTPPGAYYRAADSMVLDNTNRGIPIRNGTITYIAAQIGALASSTTIEVIVSGIPIAELECLSPGLTYSDSFDVDISHGTLSVRNKATGTATDNTQVMIGYRLR